MSLPSFSAMAMLSSGVQRMRAPSYSMARKLTPSFVSFMNSLCENTWNPPESVRMGPFQRMNLCTPPISATRSAPGRMARW